MNLKWDLYIVLVAKYSWNIKKTLVYIDQYVQDKTVNE